MGKIVVCIGKFLRQILPCCAERARRDLCGENAAHIDIEVSDLASLEHSGLQSKVEIASCPVAGGLLGFRVARSQNDHLERLTGRDLILRAERAVREAADHAVPVEVHHIVIVPAPRRNVWKYRFQLLFLPEIFLLLRVVPILLIGRADCRRQGGKQHNAQDKTKDPSLRHPRTLLSECSGNTGVSYKIATIIAERMTKCNLPGIFSGRLFFSESLLHP